jgi:hypothetical protein
VEVDDVPRAVDLERNPRPRQALHHHQRVVGEQHVGQRAHAAAGNAASTSARFVRLFEPEA